MSFSGIEQVSDRCDGDREPDPSMGHAVPCDREKWSDKSPMPVSGTSASILQKMNAWMDPNTVPTWASQYFCSHRSE